MLLKKSIIIISLILILFSFEAYAASTEDLTLKLDRKVYGTEQNFEGSMSFNMAGEVQSDAIIGLVVDGEAYGKNFVDAMNSVSKGILLAQSFQLDSRRAAISIPFSNAGDNYIGIDFKDAKTIKSINFDVSAISAISDLKIDFKNDNSTDWIYRGNPLEGTFPATRNTVFVTNDSYLKNFEDIGVTSYIEDKTFCEKVTIKPSNEYIIEAIVGKEKAGAGQVYGAIMRDITKPLGNMDLATDCYRKADNNESNKFCCQLTPANMNIADPKALNCKIDYGFDKEEDVFVCVFLNVPAESEIEPAVYSIAQEAENVGIVKAYYGGKDAKTAFLKEDFMIRAYSHKFNTKLNVGEKKTITLDGTALTKAKIKAGQELIIKVSSSSAGNIKFDNLKAEITLLSGAGSKIVGFNPVSVYPTRINYTGKVTIPLSFFDNAITPPNTGSDYSTYAAIQENEDDEITSETIDFNVIEGPVAKINLDNPFPTAGDSVKFDGSNSKARTIEKNQSIPIVTYKWNFGDNETAEEVTASHIFTEEGSYDVILSIIDRDKIGGRALITVEVGGISGSIIEQLNKSLKFVENAKADIDKSSDTVKETADMLGISDIFANAKSNLTELLATAEEINADGEMNESEKNAQFVEMKTALEAIMKDVPVDFKVSVVKFDSNADTLSAIPSAAELKLTDEEQFSEKLLKAQEGVSVKAEAKTVTIESKSGEKDEYVIITKTVTGGNGDVYEILPAGLEKKEILTDGAELVMTDGSVFKVSGNDEIIYTATGDVKKAIETITIVVPSDLSSIEVKPPVDDSGNVQKIEAVCGNNVCEVGEDSSCSKDCKVTNWPIIIIILVLGLLAAGAFYYFMVVKKSTKPGAARVLFKTEKDYESVKKYVEDSLWHKGFNEQQISLVLRKKGWTEQQVNGVIAEVKANKPKEQTAEMHTATEAKK